MLEVARYYRELGDRVAVVFTTSASAHTYRHLLIGCRRYTLGTLHHLRGFSGHLFVDHFALESATEDHLAELRLLIDSSGINAHLPPALTVANNLS